MMFRMEQVWWERKVENSRLENLCPLEAQGTNTVTQSFVWRFSGGFRTENIAMVFFFFYSRKWLVA